MNLESGPAPGFRNYNRNTYLGLLVACAGFAAWFYYDGTSGYFKENRAEARKHLTPIIGEERLPEQFSDRPVEDDFKALQQGSLRDVNLVYERLGQPTHSSTQGLARTDLFVSDFGMVEIYSNNGVVDWPRSSWRGWKHSQDDLKVQIWLSWVCLAGAIGCVFGIYRASSLRVTMDDQALTYAGRRIPFESMTSLRDYNRKGWVDLYYSADGGTRKLRLDNMKVDKFDEIIKLICDKKGFENPRPPEEDSAVESRNQDSGSA